jgi:hypothetical protein
MLCGSSQLEGCCNRGKKGGKIEGKYDKEIIRGRKIGRREK